MAWELTGNDGTDPATNFLGTKEASKPLVIQPGKGSVGIGTKTPKGKLEVIGNWDGQFGALSLAGDKPTIRFSGGAIAGNQQWLLHEGSMEVTPDSIYQLIKSYEGQFQPPAPYFTVNIGTLDGDTGAFIGRKTISDTDPEPVEHGPHDTTKSPPPHYVGEILVIVTIDAHWRRTITRAPAPKVPLQPVLLLFSISHPILDGWSITVNGETVTAEPEQTSLQANIWDSVPANWTIRAGNTSFTDTIRMQRPPGVVVGAAVGAFTIPALPVTIVYAPSADSLKPSTAS